MGRKPTSKPDVFQYVDYRAFLKDWFAFLKKEKKLLATHVAAQAQLSGGFLSMMLAGKRELSLDSALKLLPCLQLTKTERNYLENLVRLSQLDTGVSRVAAVRKMQSYTSFRKSHEKDAVFFQYVSNWYYAAIREMASLPGFSEDPEAIRARLRAKATLAEIKDALQFLEKHGFLKRNEEGKLSAAQETLHARGLLYWTALTQFHKDMFEQATQSIEDASAEERDIQGYTLTMSPERFQKAREILNKALDELEKLSNETEANVDSVYQVEIALFPLTRKSEGAPAGKEGKKP